MSFKVFMELFGYLGSALVLVSFLMSSVVKLRLINLGGCIVSGLYSLFMHTYPMVLMNGALAIINIYYLTKLLKKEDNFTVVHCECNDSYYQYLLNQFKEDIHHFFPDCSEKETNEVFVTCIDTLPVGILCGKRKGNVLTIAFDYTISSYRDCSVAKTLYEDIKNYGITELIYQGENALHHDYMLKVGFKKENQIYQKKL